MYIYMYIYSRVRTYVYHILIYIRTYVSTDVRTYFVAIGNENKLLTVSNNYTYNTYIYVRMPSIHSVHTYVQGY